MGEASAHAEVVVRSRGWVTGRISYLPAVATLRDGELRVVSHASRRGGRPAYDKTMAVPRGTSTARPARRPHSLRVVAPPPPAASPRSASSTAARARASPSGRAPSRTRSARRGARARARRRRRRRARPSGVEGPREAFVVRVDASAARARWARAIGAVALPARLALLRASGARAGGRRRGADDAFAEDLAAVVTRDFTLASLGRSVAYLARGGGVASVGDAALALVAVKCVRLVGLVPHALGELARLKRERANLKRFAFGALQLRLPLLSAVVCDLLAALCKEKEGLRVVDAVLDRVDGAARFGDAALARAPLAPAGAARRRGRAAPRRARGPAQRARRRRAARRGGRGSSPRPATRRRRGPRRSRAARCTARRTPSCASRPRPRRPRRRSRRVRRGTARRRRGGGARRRTCSRAAAGAARARGSTGARRSSRSRAAAAAGDPAARALGAAADAFLGACDARERDEAADCDAAAPGGERRGQGQQKSDARADGVLRALGEDLEADRASLGAGGGPRRRGGDPPRSRTLRAMDGDLVFGDGLADLDARMTRTVADRRAARGAEPPRAAPPRARDAARRGHAAAAADAARTAPAAARATTRGSSATRAC
ncbi:hypothetical protein JL722_3725 [Aureococcus anophagefferens]|nr:hypothetical protein JL722_3725 [Aureococcus anophagefferens]